MNILDTFDRDNHKPYHPHRLHKFNYLNNEYNIQYIFSKFLIHSNNTNWCIINKFREIYTPYMEINNVHMYDFRLNSNKMRIMYNSLLLLHTINKGFDIPHIDHQY